LVAFVIQLVVATIVLAPVLWLAGRALVGKDKAKFTDAVWIVVLGIVIGTVFGALNLGLIGLIIQLILWLYLIKHFFDCGWLMAFVIAIVAVVIFAVIAIILGLIGFAVITFI
jgi:hypothetical protein